MLTFKDASGKDLLVIHDNGEIFIEDKELEKSMKETSEEANRLAEKEEE